MAPEEQWDDITDVYAATSERLAPHRMIHADNFALNNVMHAMEAMDSKMDPGYGYKDRKNLLELVYEDRINRNPDLPTTLCLMQYLLEAEASFLTGNYVVTTLLGCVYFYDHSLIESPLVLAYLQAVCVSVNMYMNSAIIADVREEEEFGPQWFEVPHCEDLKPNQAIDRLQRALAAAKKELKESDRADVDAPVLAAIASLVDFRSRLLRSLDALVLAKLNDATLRVQELQDCIPGIRALRTEAEASAPNGGGEAKNDPVDGHNGPRSQSPGAADQADGASGEKKAGLPPVPPIDGIIFDEARTWAVTTHMLNVTPNPNWTETLDLFEKLATELLVVASVDREVSNFPELIDFIETFSARRPSPHLVSRSFLMTLVYDQKSLVLRKHKMFDLILRNLSEQYGATIFQSLYDNPLTVTSLIVPPAKPSPDQVPPRDYLMQFLDRFMKGILQYCYALLHNRARCRRRLSNLFRDWGFVQEVAWECDAYVFDGGLMTDRTIPVELAKKLGILSALVNGYVLRSMRLFLCLGFELDLYCPTEVPETTWYLHYLTYLQVENQREMYKTRSLTQAEAQAVRKATKKLVAGGGIPPSFATRDVREIPAAHIETLEACVSLHKVVYTLCAAFTVAGYLRDPGPPERRMKYCDRASRYEHRLMPFLSLMKPPFVRYASFLRHYQFPEDPAAIIYEVKRNVDHCLMLVERAKLMQPTEKDARTLKELQTVAKANSVAAMVLSQLVSNPQVDDAAKPSVFFDWTYSTSYPVIKVRRDVGRKAGAS
ncbi:N-alpha-acetyltransferase [Diplonema papillatum]|nr:N-alpha-acetyltransferase [Diplonema papillatum]